MLPRYTLARVFQDDVIPGASTDPEHLGPKFVLCVQRVAAVDEDLHDKTPL
jgi:hypothetical protein